MMSPIHVTPINQERAICPMCGFLCAVKSGGVYQCLSNAIIDRCRFYGTKEKAQQLKLEKVECKKNTALNAAS